MRHPAVLARQSCAGREQNGRVRDRPQVEVTRPQFPIRTGGRSIEEQREAVRRPDLTEHDRSIERVLDAQPADVDTFARQEIADELAMPVVADLAHDRG